MNLTDRRREFVRKQKAKRLPSEYQEVEYIQSTIYGGVNGPYIDTGVVPNQDTKLYLFGEGEAAQSIMCRAALKTNDFSFIYTASSTYRSNMGTNEVSSKSITQYSGLVELTKDRTSSVLENSNGQTVRLTHGNVSNFTCTGNLLIFAARIATDSFALRDGKIMKYKLWNNDVLQRDFVPCYRKSDGEIGMYDLVSQTFFTNAGTGEFQKGADV